MWFSANGAAAELQQRWEISAAGIGWLTNAVQAGFIAGTLLVSLSGLADRMPASRLFALSSVLGAAANAAFAAFDPSLAVAIGLRFVVGLSLAGIYPLGMKLVMSWTRGDTAMTLAFLVGMLSLGTAVPHGIRAWLPELPWQAAVQASSWLAVAGGVCVAALGDGPFTSANRPGEGARWGAVFQAFKVPAFRSAAFGYFGHMWELYAFWTLVPFLLAGAVGGDARSVSLGSFAVIAAGAVGSVATGRFARRVGSARAAAAALACSGLFCAVYPVLASVPDGFKLVALSIWGLAVVADSAQFSSLSGKACPPHLLGSALAIQNAIGFAITLVAIGISTAALDYLGAYVAWLLLPGPVLGLLAMRRLLVVPPVSGRMGSPGPTA